MPHRVASKGTLMTACRAVAMSHMPVLAARALPDPAGSSAMGTAAA